MTGTLVKAPRATATMTLLVAVLLLLGACAHPGSRPTMTLTQAEAEVERLLGFAASRIPGTTLEVVVSPIESRCDSPTDGGPLGRSFLTSYGQVQPVPDPAEAAVLFDILVAELPREGWEVTVDTRTTSRSPQVSFIRLSDSFLIGYVYSGDGRLTVNAGSACVWPDGTRAPRS